jgi:predicted glycogen debranching enzyme
VVTIEFGKADWRTFEQGILREWLLTNGIGGFASSTIIGANTRRYHGLLVASLSPPVQRHLILSKIDESIEIYGRHYNFYSFQTPDYIMKGYTYLQRVIINPLPTFIYSIEDVLIEKKISMVYGKNTTAVVYRILNGGSNVKLKLTPLVNFRDYHHNSNRAYMSFTHSAYDERLLIRPGNYDLDINIYCSDGIFVRKEDCWFFNMDYPVERERGLQSTEDHFIPGYFVVELKPWENKCITLISTIEKEISNKDGVAIIAEEEERIKKLLDITGYKDDFALKLAAAADNFIVHRESTEGKTIIAGYPWFTDWGRDTMIALPGLTLCTRRFKDAKEILQTFAKHSRYGLVPNVFSDAGHEPAYNTADAALWYFEAVFKFIEYTGDYLFIQENIYTVLKEIVDSYINGTKFDIKMDSDYLICAGNEDTQLTWMDAKIGEWVVTPRYGKAVEINALWYNALRVMSYLSGKFEDTHFLYSEIANKVKYSFESSFWNEEKQCLYDVVREDLKDDRVRPNQVIAVSLSYPVIKGEKARKVIEKVWRELYTAYGLRSLSPSSSEYVGVYKGTQHSRDGAYHQGTVWAWLTGRFITGYLKIYGYTDENKRRAAMLIEPFKDHLRDAGIGSISEIFDGNEPLTPRGCFAQAWSVGEVLRAYVEDLGIE